MIAWRKLSKKLRISIYQEWMKGLPWWFSAKESAYRCRKLKFPPLSRNTPHGPEQLSLCHNLWACALEPGNAVTEATSHTSWSLHALEPVLRKETTPQWGVWALQLQGSARQPHLETAHTCSSKDSTAKRGKKEWMKEQVANLGKGFTMYVTDKGLVWGRVKSS